MSGSSDSAGSAPAAPEARALVLVVVDSLRRDALGCYGGGETRTPCADRLAEESVVFERVSTAAPWTVPSVAAMLTGLYAHRLGLVRWEQPWAGERADLFALARGAGCEVASFVFDPRFMFRGTPSAGVVGSSQDTEALLAWLRPRRGERFFLFVHYWWTHVPYLDRPMSTEAWRRASEAVLEALRAGGEARRGVERLYRRGVGRWSEVWLPRLLEALDLDTTALVVTADHGESFGDRADAGPARTVFDLHGNALYEEVLRVPLLVRLPRGRGRRVPGLARTVDLAPTLARLFAPGAELPPELDGVDLGACLAGGSPAPATEAIASRARDFLSTREHPRSAADLYVEMALSTARHKLLWEPAKGRRRAFDLEVDPGETSPLPEAGGEAHEEGFARLEAELARAVVAPPAPDLPAPLVARLRALRYLD